MEKIISTAFTGRLTANRITSIAFRFRVYAHGEEKIKKIWNWNENVRVWRGRKKYMWEKKKKNCFARLELILIDLLAFVIGIYSKNFMTSFIVFFFIFSLYRIVSAQTRFRWDFVNENIWSATLVGKFKQKASIKNIYLYKSIN